MKPGSTLAFLLMVLVAFAHVVRLALHVDITVAGNAIPQWVSIGGIAVPLAIAWLLWRERSTKAG